MAWRIVPDTNYKYEVSSDGKIRRLKSNKKTLLKPCNQHGYRSVYINGKMMAIHRLVCRAFIGEIKPGLQVNHKNGIKHDNRLKNLEIVTPQYNVQHGVDLAKSRRTFMTTGQVLELFGITKMTLYKWIFKGKINAIRTEIGDRLFLEFNPREVKRAKARMEKESGAD